ncbi:hypothetical protein AGMMS49944_25200 [Spirochaetia bacterium]|nr:hypothetical protein AGMMS49944_25200 [Spirochaetia bacterium]
MDRLPDYLEYPFKQNIQILDLVQFRIGTKNGFKISYFMRQWMFPQFLLFLSAEDSNCLTLFDPFKNIIGP